jgi:hypothetical protein
VNRCIRFGSGMDGNQVQAAMTRRCISADIARRLAVTGRKP